MPAKTVPPSISETSFNCPHCGALAHQVWHDVYAVRIPKNETPSRYDSNNIADVRADCTVPAEIRQSLLEFLERAARGDVLLESSSKGHYQEPQVINLNISHCYNCKHLSVWVHDRLLHPPRRTGDEANEDLPADILQDYEEARSILDLSPRGAAALLRLCIQKLCIHLGESGKNLDKDIANLVQNGLDRRVQRALDIVRVIGNESVHPGTIDMRDNRDTANELFRLVNLIADVMISQPKHIEAMYDALPESKREAIERRDRKTPGDG